MDKEKINDFSYSENSANADDLIDKLSDIISKPLLNLYAEFTNNLSQELIDCAVNLLNKVARTVCTIITNQIDIHKELYEENENYKAFVNNLWKDKDYKKLVNMGERSKSLEAVNAVRSLGLSALIKKVTRTDKKSITKKITKWVHDCEIVMYTFNISLEHGVSFPAMFFATLSVRETLLDDILKKASSI